VLKPPFQIFLLHSFLSLLNLSSFGVFIVEHLAEIELIPIEVVLKIVLTVTGNDLLINGLRKFGDGILLSLHIAFQLLVASSKTKDLFVFDEAKRVLEIAESMTEIVGLLRE
jgi:hypothetical protein